MKRLLLLIVLFQGFAQAQQSDSLDIIARRCFNQVSEIIVTYVDTTMVPPYTYSLDGQNFQTEDYWLDFPDGPHTVSVWDATGRVINQEVNIVPSPEIFYRTKGLDPTCDQTGGLFLIEMNGGLEPLTWLVNGNPVQKSIDDSTTLGPGQYLTYAIDTAGCFVERVVTLLDACITPYNAITPNGDGFNDTWSIPKLENFPEAVVSVYNSHGTRVFQSKGEYEPWDGTWLNNTLTTGTYYYIITPYGKDESRGRVDGRISLIKE